MAVVIITGAKAKVRPGRVMSRKVHIRRRARQDSQVKQEQDPPPEAFCVQYESKGPPRSVLNSYSYPQTF